ncbi:MAG TPA: D-2-hydroxyacid dehydrogenase [Candidatus Avamphibacillus sp.]|nr:D-2-hydroxyacid dehydrogenase [Candidatus Avamphibacillus sp.]
MAILFSLKISDEDKKELKANYRQQEFIFCENMDEAKEHISKAEVIVTYGNDLNETLVEQATRLNWVCVLSAGVDGLPFEALNKKDILVTNVRGIHKVPMSEYAISMLMQVYRREKILMEKERNHEWYRSSRPLEISGKTMLIAGTGAIGREVARLAKAFHMKTIGVSRSGRELEYFDENVTTDKIKFRLPEADFIVSVLPSTKETKHFYTYDFFEMMKDSAIFLNMGRGDAVESDVIVKAIKEKEIMHAVLDVFEEEPLPENHPLWNLENVTITPHISGISPNYLPRALEILKENLDIYTKGRSDFINKIDISRGY